MAASSFHSSVNDSAINFYVNNPRGAVYADLKKRANRVQRAAKRMVGADTGALRRSIQTRVVPSRTPRIEIGSPLDHAELHHTGTRPHVIRPHLRRALRFKIRGRVVYAEQVWHPGTRSNPYLTVPLERYGRG